MSQEQEDTPTADKYAKKIVELSTTEIPYSEDLAQSVVCSFCDITEPEEWLTIERITLDREGRGGGTSRKPGNIVLNWRKLFRTVPSIALAGAGAASLPWLFPLAALHIWCEVRAQSEVELSPQHAITMKAMWENHDGRRRISEADALQATNRQLLEFEFNSLNKRNFAELVDDLVRIGCIKLDEGSIWLREWTRRRL